MNQTLKTILACFFAVNLTGLGVALLVQANLGSDTITVFIDGFKNIFHTSLGGASRIYNFIVLVIAMFLSRKDIGWCTIIYALTVGFAMDFYNALILNMHISQMSILIRIIVVVLGQLCFILTYVLLIFYREGMNQLDAIAYGIEKRTKISYKYIRTIEDVVLLVMGWLMGGVVGIGSIITMTTTGFGVDVFLNLLECKEKSV